MKRVLVLVLSLFAGVAPLMAKELFFSDFNNVYRIYKGKENGAAVNYLQFLPTQSDGGYGFLYEGRYYPLIVNGVQLTEEFSVIDEIGFTLGVNKEKIGVSPFNVGVAFNPSRETGVSIRFTEKGFEVKTLERSEGRTQERLVEKKNFYKYKAPIERFNTIRMQFDGKLTVTINGEPYTAALPKSFSAELSDRATMLFFIDNSYLVFDAIEIANAEKTRRFDFSVQCVTYYKAVSITSDKNLDLNPMEP